VCVSCVDVLLIFREVPTTRRTYQVRAFMIFGTYLLVYEGRNAWTFEVLDVHVW